METFPSKCQKPFLASKMMKIRYEICVNSQMNITGWVGCLPRSSRKFLQKWVFGQIFSLGNPFVQFRRLQSMWERHDYLIITYLIIGPLPRWWLTVAWRTSQFWSHPGRLCHLGRYTWATESSQTHSTNPSLALIPQNQHDRLGRSPGRTILNTWVPRNKHVHYPTWSHSNTCTQVLRVHVRSTCTGYAKVAYLSGLLSTRSTTPNNISYQPGNYHRHVATWSLKVRRPGEL